LHIQCSWRITFGNEIVVASGDIYSPNSEGGYDIEDFDWDIQGNNRFDERIKFFMKENEQLMVEQIESDEFGGLKVFFSGGYIL
jgi:hypothetical protein